jgi:hypothetical protein
VSLNRCPDEITAAGGKADVAPFDVIDHGAGQPAIEAIARRRLDILSWVGRSFSWPRTRLPRPDSGRGILRCHTDLRSIACKDELIEADVIDGRKEFGSAGGLGHAIHAENQ